MKKNNLNDINYQSYISNSIIFIETHWSNVEDKIKSYIKTICCKNNDFFCDKCEFCEKINNNSYYDLLEFNCYYSNTKKEEIIDMQNTFAYSGLEAIQKKICVIYGIEKLNKFAYNSLLKIIEDSHQNNYFIFSTRNLEMVPSTIKSRSKIIRLIPEKEKSILFIRKYYKDEEIITNILNSYFSISEIKQALENDEINQIYQISLEIIASKKDEAIEKDTSNKFKKMNYFQIEKLLLFLLSKINIKNKIKYLELIDSLKFNINKILIFNKLLNFLEK